MPDTLTARDHLLELSSAITCYLSLISAVGDCVGRACPDVGGPYRKRIEQLRTRVFFESTPKAIKSSLKVMEGELSDYSAVAAQYLDQHDLDLRRTIVALEQAMDQLAASHAFQASEILNLSERLEASGSEAPVSPGFLAQELRRTVERMNRDSDSILAGVRREIAGAEERLRGIGSTDASTGLLNAREITRQKEAYQMSGVVFSMLRFELHGNVTEPVMKQAAARLEKQFRHRDRIARWSETEFLVLFQGPAKMAESRATQVARLLGGTYQLSTGGRVEIMAHAELVDQELALA